MKPCDYYVYAHKTPDGRVFYVGKGRGNRQYQTGNRSVFWKRIKQKYGYTSTLLEENLNEQDAYTKEIEWIQYYKARGECEANFTDGGDGVRVERRWWGKTISRAKTGKAMPRGRDSKSFKDNISTETLIHCYVNEGLSSTEISQRCELSYTTVISRLRDAGIEVRTAGREARPIRCLTDGREFNSINDAAKYYALFRENIRKVLNGKYKHTGGRTFEYAHVGDGNQ